MCAIKSKTVKVIETEGDKGLFEKLRSLCTKIAKKYGLSPYVIFHDRTLYELVSYLPDSLDEMHGIHGIGEAKLKNYGQRFLEVISGHIKTYGTKEKV
ncbi:MAG: HRDC domain-containing protein [Desulfobacterales bacterium]|nr:HRDC domain-containing protein [Desulfobacterales bacterium]